LKMMGLANKSGNKCLFVAQKLGCSLAVLSTAGVT
jgi:hypothetical protein